jgi:glutaminase
LSEQALLAGVAAAELEQLAALGTLRSYQPGERIISAAETATSLFFLRSGVVHVMLPSGVRLATIAAGMVFGEMALLESRRSADVIADVASTALEVPLAEFRRFREQHPRTGEGIMRNLAQLLADRLVVANNKVSLLTAN